MLTGRGEYPQVGRGRPRFLGYARNDMGYLQDGVSAGGKGAARQGAGDWRRMVNSAGRLSSVNSNGPGGEVRP